MEVILKNVRIKYEWKAIDYDFYKIKLFLKNIKLKRGVWYYFSLNYIFGSKIFFILVWKTQEKSTKWTSVTANETKKHKQSPFSVFSSFYYTHEGKDYFKSM